MSARSFDHPDLSGQFCEDSRPLRASSRISRPPASAQPPRCTHRPTGPRSRNRPSARPRDAPRVLGARLVRHRTSRRRLSASAIITPAQSARSAAAAARAARAEPARASAVSATATRRVRLDGAAALARAARGGDACGERRSAPCAGRRRRLGRASCSPPSARPRTVCHLILAGRGLQSRRPCGTPATASVACCTPKPTRSRAELRRGRRRRVRPFGKRATWWS